MNFSLIQLEYIVAVSTWRNFHVAADKCSITQPTLSMQIQKMEDELGIRIFDRSKKPVVPTEAGEAIIEQARKVLHEAQLITEVVLEQKNLTEGTLRIGILPTLAPYLLPLFIISFLESNPSIHLDIIELKAEAILEKLKLGELDGGILSTPITDRGFFVQKLFLEEFIAYVSPDSFAASKQRLTYDDLSGETLWLIEEGHCLREQVIKSCSLQGNNYGMEKYQHQTGSVETLMHLVDIHGGLTLIPQLATLNVYSVQAENLRSFKPPAPAREISLVTHRNLLKKPLLDILIDSIMQSIRNHLR
jgi:LysR family transcriptional regulator, hydrogen peroxide-inducible genes activator